MHPIVDTQQIKVLINSFALVRLNLSRLFEHTGAQPWIKHCSTGIRSFGEAPVAPQHQTLGKRSHPLQAGSDSIQHFTCYAQDSVYSLLKNDFCFRSVNLDHD